MKNPFSFFRRGVICFKTHQWLAAICHFSDVLKVVPFQADSLLYRGRCFVYLKQSRQAIEDFTVYTEQFPDDHAGFYYVGRAHTVTGDFATAIEWFSKALERAPDSAKTLVRRGLSKHHLKLDEPALEDITQALKLNALYVKAYNAFGIIHHGLQSFAIGEKNYEIASALNQFYFKALYNRGNLHLDLHDYHKAAEWFNLAIAMKADYTDAHFNRGTALHSLFLLQEAMADYKKTIELDPRDFDAYINLGSIELHSNQYEMALEYFDRAWELTKDKDADARNTCVRWRGQVLYLLGFFGSAQSILATSVTERKRSRTENRPAFDKELYPIEFFLGLSANRCGHTEFALRILDSARGHSKTGIAKRSRGMITALSFLTLFHILTGEQY